MKITIGTIIIVSIILRIIPILILSKYECIEEHKIFLTDIDYKVYSDSRKYQSPYDRNTYRYTPILSYMMYFNQNAQFAGKIIFCLWDALAIAILYRIVIKNTSDKSALFICKLYGYNPLLIYLTVRGSCQSITVFLMYLCWYLMFNEHVTGNQTLQYRVNKNKKTIKSLQKYFGYVVYGLWVHFRIYPIIFLPLILYQQWKICKSIRFWLKSLLQITIFSGGVFFCLALLFYILYGWSFLEQTYFYHLKRYDNRHSFSPFFYDMYLNYKPQANSIIRSLIRSLPILFLILFLSTKYCYFHSTFYLHFLLTYGFVIFNKVITMQYYMWIWGALLLVISQSRIIIFNNYRKGLNLIIQWYLGIFLWVWLSKKLEDNGENVFQVMWIICLVNMFFHLWVLRIFMKTMRPLTPKQIKELQLEKAKKTLNINGHIKSN